MKKIIIIIIAILGLKGYSQTSDNLIVLLGIKSIEVGYSYNNDDFLNFGYSVSIVDSKQTQKRANNNDIYKRNHEFNGKFTPAFFGLIGASFDPITITGKLGAVYLDQRIDDIQDNQKIYFAVGIILSHKLTERFSLSGTYDNVNAAGLGLTYKF